MRGKDIKEAENIEAFRSKNDLNSCFQCNVSFKTEKLFKSHLFQHNVVMQDEEQTKDKFKCNQCAKTFTSKGFIKYHLLCHSKPKINFPCDICKNEFSNKQGLRIHLKIHDGIKEF